MQPSDLFKKTFFVIFCLFFTACGGGSGETASSSSFEGIWLDEDILEFRETGDSQYICERTEVLNDVTELTIDGLVIDSSGNVRDFSLHYQVGVAWKVRNDGTTYDNYLIQNKDSGEGAENLVDNRMTVEGNELKNIWLLSTEDGGTRESPVTYIRSNPAEVAELKNIVENCP